MSMSTFGRDAQLYQQQLDLLYYIRHSSSCACPLNKHGLNRLYKSLIWAVVNLISVAVRNDCTVSKMERVGYTEMVCWDGNASSDCPRVARKCPYKSQFTRPVLLLSSARYAYTPGRWTTRCICNAQLDAFTIRYELLSYDR